ncbi:MAG: methyltransferase domain-containing protein [Acidobacteria bacterium]|nr:methyltransferase domain-containing protein [Acidobacteriota bacterium]
MSANNQKNTELAGLLHEIRERLTSKFARVVPEDPELNLPSTEPLQKSQAEAGRLVSAIGTVNPRPSSLANDLIQMCKNAFARLLDWQVRPQREFNRAVVESLAGVTEVLQDQNRNFTILAESVKHSNRVSEGLGQEIDNFEKRLADLGVQFEEQMKLHRWAYDGVMARQSSALQDRTFELLEALQEQIHEELRILRQRVTAQARAAQAKPDDARMVVADSCAGSSGKTTLPPGIDYFQLERHFRGTEEEVRARQRFYLPLFQGRKKVLDIACGRGEFLELMREAGAGCRGIDLSPDMVGCCLEKGLDVVEADAFRYLETVPDGSLDGIFCAQFVEHLEPQAYIRLISRCVAKLAPAGILAVETQNPECLAIFSKTFFLDPTHVRPIPPAQMRFLFAEAGLRKITTHFLSPAAGGLAVIPQLESQVIEADALQAWNAAVIEFNETYFGGMDYAVIGYRAAAASSAESPDRKKSQKTPLQE